MEGALSAWERCVEGRRRWLWGQWKDPLYRSEYYALGCYGRALQRAEWKLRWWREPEPVRRSLLEVLDAQRQYALRRRWDLFPSQRWRSHKSEYFEAGRYLREIDLLRGNLKWPSSFDLKRAREVLRRAMQEEVLLLRARMEDIRRGNRRYWQNEEYRCLERCVRDLERKAKGLR